MSSGDALASPSLARRVAGQGAMLFSGFAASQIMSFLRNAIRRPDRGGRADGSEFAGGCFSPDGRLFFVNTQGIGITLAVFRDDGAPIAVSAVGVTPG